MTMDKRPHISAKNKTDLLPNEGVLHAASEGGAGCTSRGSRITVGIASRTAQLETPCVKGGTHPPQRSTPPSQRRYPHGTLSALAGCPLPAGEANAPSRVL